MNKWRLIPKIRYTNYIKQFPNSRDIWQKWFAVGRLWSGRIIEINVKHHALTFDFRKNWLADMVDFSK